MKEIILPYFLAQIQLTTVDNEFRATRSNLSKLEFDQRHDFILTLPSPQLAVRLILCLYDKAPRGVRRRVVVSLSDASDRNILCSISILAYLKKSEIYSDVKVCLPIDYDEIDFTHPYVVTVRDEKTGQILSERELHFFKQFHGGIYTPEILKPEYGGIQPDFSWQLYKSIDADTLTSQNIRFHLRQEDTLLNSPFLPEMEVRIYLPDGSVESKFVTPIHDEDDEPDMYYVFAPIFMISSKKGIGYAELICFDVPIAGFVFNTAGESVYGYWSGADIMPLDEYSHEAASARFKETIGEPVGKTPLPNEEDFDNLLDKFISSQIGEEEADTPEPERAPMPVKEEPVSPLRSLENLTGLRSVKEKLLAYEKLVIFNKKREESKLPILKLPLHAMFWGSPGTGKTTVAKRMGLMLKRAGVLSKGHVVIKERSTLLGPYYSNEETNTQAAIEEAQGGILFIDEAYQLYQPNDPRDPGKFVIETLMTALADESKRDWMLILAGYTDEMKRMFEMNPGLKSRIPNSNIYIFDDFSKEELMEIAERYLERNSYSLTEEAKTALKSRLGNDYSHRDRSFGNARHVINLIQSEILPNMATRVVETNDFDQSALSLIQSSDIPQPLNLCVQKNARIGYRV